MRLSHAFTLIELLVAISIIALLVAILLPALKAARDATRATVCASNLRQLSIGIAAYAADAKQEIVAGSRTSGSTWITWATYVSGDRVVTASGGMSGSFAYVEPGPVYGCPSFESYDALVSGDKYARIHGNVSEAAYGMYFPIGSDQAARGWDFSEKISGPGNAFWTVIPIDQIPQTSVVAALSESSRKRNWGDINMNAPRQIGVWNPDDPFAVLWNARIRMMHSEAANISYFDGHVDRLDAVAMFESPMRIRKFWSQDHTAIDY